MSVCIIFKKERNRKKKERTEGETSDSFDVIFKERKKKVKKKERKKERIM